MFASLLLVTAALTGCDAPEASPVDTSGAEEPMPEEDEPTPGPEPMPEEDEPVCEPAPVVLPRVMFVLDKSSSMTSSGEESGAPVDESGLTRWAQLHAAVGSLARALEGDAVMGAVLFPSTYAEKTGEAVCEVRSVPEAAVGPYRAADLMKLLPRANMKGFRGGSPAQAAYATALDHLATLGGSAPTAIVLVTDGGLNCADDVAPLAVADDGLAELVGFARESLQISTFVIGVGVAPGDQSVPSGDPNVALREIALAGGAAHGELGYFAATDPASLSAALAAFVAGAAAPATTCR